MKQIKVVSGTEDYLMSRDYHNFFDYWKRQFAEDVEIVRFTKETPVPVVVEALEDTSLFGSANLYVWTDCPFLPLKKGGRSRSKLSKEETWFLEKLAQMPERQALLFFTKGNLDTGCVFYKKLAGLADTVKRAEVSDKDIMPYVTEYLRQKGQTLSPAAERFLHGLFQTWESIPLLYVFSELDKLCINLGDHKPKIETKDLKGLFSGTMEKNLFTFMDFFLRRDGARAIPFLNGLFSRQDLFLKNTGYMMSQLRSLRAYKELLRNHVGPAQCASIMAGTQKGRNVKYLLYRLQKVETYWKIEELDRLICQIFTLQLNIRRGMASAADMGPLICLYVSDQR